MNKNLIFMILGIVAVIGGGIAAILLLKKKAREDDEYDFDDFDNAIDDEEFAHFFGVEDDFEELQEDDVEEVPDVEDDRL